MKKVLSIIPVFLLIMFHCAVAQIGMIKLGKEKVSYSFIQRLGSMRNADMPNFSLLRSKVPGMKRTPELLTAKLVRNDTKNKPSKTNEISAFSFGTFDQPKDGGGIDIKLAGRTSLNLDLIGCYEGSDPNAANDSCGQSPDLDMSISFVFDLKK